MAASKGSPWMGPSFTWMDQAPRLDAPGTKGPWTHYPTRLVFPAPHPADRLTSKRSSDRLGRSERLAVKTIHSSVSVLYSVEKRYNLGKSAVSSFSLKCRPGRPAGKRFFWHRGYLPHAYGRVEQKNLGRLFQRRKREEDVIGQER